MRSVQPKGAALTNPIRHKGAGGTVPDSGKGRWSKHNNSVRYLLQTKRAVASRIPRKAARDHRPASRARCSQSGERQNLHRKLLGLDGASAWCETWRSSVSRENEDGPDEPNFEVREVTLRESSGCFESRAHSNRPKIPRPVHLAE